MTSINPQNLSAPAAHTPSYAAAMEMLVDVVQRLSLARDLDAVIAIVRKAARELTGADGATFVLRDNDKCHYADEDAISPLWKGQRFPMKSCISGWVMFNGTPAVIEDIYKDPRIPADAYRPTFVKSLAMVPIRAEDPIGAIGNYWAHKRLPTDEEVKILQALAHVTAVAMENAALYARLREKLAALEKSNHELSRFAWAASHDLKGPLRGIDHLSKWIAEDIEAGDGKKAREHLGLLCRRVNRMEKLLGDILDYAHTGHGLPGGEEMADGGTVIRDVMDLTDVPAGFSIRFSGDFEKIAVPRVAMQRVLCNLIGNAFKHHDRAQGTVEIGVTDEGPLYIFTVRDDGPGIPPAYREKIFEMFQTLKPRDEKDGSGMGLAMVRKILSFYGGEIALEPGTGRGAVFRFTWPKTFIQQGADAP